MSQICNFNTLLFLLSPTEIIDQSTTVQLYDLLKGPNAISADRFKCSYHTFPLLLLIKFDLYEDLAEFLFIYAHWDNLQGVMIYTYSTKKRKRQPLSLPLLAYTLMKFNEMKFSTTSTGVGRIILKCFITAVVVACGMSLFGVWHDSFITIRWRTKGHWICHNTSNSFFFFF